LKDILQNIQSMGLTQYEAKVYLSLVSRGSSNAYQVSKASGVPRARVYEVLDNLVQHGFVMKEETDGGTQYSSLPVEVLLDSVKTKWEATYNSLETKLRSLEKKMPESEIYVTTIQGEENIVAFCRVLIRRAERRVLLSLWEPMYRKLKEELRAKQDQCLLGGLLFQVNDPLPGLEVHRKTHHIDHEDHPWFILSIDGKELFYGHSPEQSSRAFYTDDPVHIYMLEDYIWHDVLVNRLVARDKQEELEQWITRARKSFFGE
jgi:HTH-type transcriptional regulator, sugar sensing transcriptional regulator